MTTLEHRNHLGRWHQRHPGPLVCTCPMPDPTPSDMCTRCLRVIANLIHQRRHMP